MKVGILTYHAACNFGANLQVLSTVSYFVNHGYNTVVINWIPSALDQYYKCVTPDAQYETHKAFREKLLPLTRPCLTDEEIANVIEEEKIDFIIVGSDAVMQHHPFLSRIRFPTKRIFNIQKIGADRLCPNPFWGSFLSKLGREIPMCIMSGSSQNSAYKLMSPKECNKMSSCLNQFRYISVRDEWTADMVKYVSSGQIVPPVTPDPVFAFNYNVKNQQTEDDVRKKFNLPQKYCLFSFHNSKTVSIKWLSEIERLFLSKGVECVALPFPQGSGFLHPFSHEIKLPLDPLDWYALIKHSFGYVGHNMHPIVVSLHNGVPCFSFDNYGITKLQFFVNEQSSKIYHIMKKFGVLQNRVCSHRFSKSPSPEFVFNKILEYNVDQVLLKRDIVYREYSCMMNDIENVVK